MLKTAIVFGIGITTIGLIKLVEWFIKDYILGIVLVIGIWLASLIYFIMFLRETLKNTEAVKW